MTVERVLRAVLLESECLPSHFVLSAISDLQLVFPSDRLRGQVASRRGDRSCISRQPLSIGFQFFYVYVRTLYVFSPSLPLFVFLFSFYSIRFASALFARRLFPREKDDVDCLIVDGRGVVAIVSSRRIRRIVETYYANNGFVSEHGLSSRRFFRPERRKI